MANQEHVKWLREGVEAWNERRERENFRPDLSRAYLGRANLSGADFSHSNLREAILYLCLPLIADLSGAVLQYVNLSGAHLLSADLSGTRLSYSEPWKAQLYAPPEDSGKVRATIQGTADEAQQNKRKKIKSIESLLHECRDLRDKYRDDILFYFRGESRTSRELRPSVMRPSPEGKFPFREWEGEMLLDLMSRQPEGFSGLTLAINGCSHSITGSRHGSSISHETHSLPCLMSVKNTTHKAALTMEMVAYIFSRCHEI